MFCSKCGAENKESAKFCRKCGAALGAKITSQINADDRKPSDVGKTVGREKVIIGGSFIFVIAALIVLTIIMQPKELILNGGEPMEIYVDDWDYITVSESSNKLTEEDFYNIIWTADDESILSVNDMEVEAYYDEDYFEEADGECTCTTNVHATLKKGIRTWEGTLPVTIVLMPVDFESGEILLSPYDSEDSHITVTPSDTEDVMMYLKSQTDPDNDMSFLVKKGEVTKVDVPRDRYIIYSARGETWYGEDYLFGPYTSYGKDTEVTDFTDATWQYAFGVTDGNVDSESIDSNEFPGTMLL